MSINSLTNLHSAIINICWIHHFQPKLLYSYHYSAKIHCPPTYKLYLAKYYFNWFELILQSVNLVFIQYHTFIDLRFPIWHELQRGFLEITPQARLTLYCRIWGFISRRIINTLNILIVVPDYTLYPAPSIFSIFCTFSFHYENRRTWTTILKKKKLKFGR